MRIDVQFKENDQKFEALFKENDQKFEAEFKEIQIVHDGKIPKEYGLITYNQDKTITIT